MDKEQLPQLGISKLDDKNRITIPKQVLIFLNLKPGDYVSVERHNSTICLLKGYFAVRGRCNTQNNNQQTSERKNSA